MLTQAAVSKLLEVIVTYFKPGAKLTLIVRFAGHDDRDFILTDDEIPEAVKALERHQTRA